MFVFFGMSKTQFTRGVIDCREGGKKGRKFGGIEKSLELYHFAKRKAAHLKTYRHTASPANPVEHRPTRTW
jgi:hypothetical protein